MNRSRELANPDQPNQSSTSSPSTSYQHQSNTIAELPSLSRDFLGLQLNEKLEKIGLNNQEGSFDKNESDKFRFGHSLQDLKLTRQINSNENNNNDDQANENDNEEGKTQIIKTWNNSSQYILTHSSFRN
jgi:hypothetical protein